MRLLDLFCGAGGAAMGYSQAGFDEIVGIDIVPQLNYPFEFRFGNALAMPAKYLRGFDLIHASPPCQGYSRMRHLPWLKHKEYPLLIDPVREMLQQSGVPWVIENVEDSPLQRAPGLFGLHGVLLCGSMFGLPIYRHRPFESSVMLPQPSHPRHAAVISSGRMLGDRARVPVQKGIGGHIGNVQRVRDAMGIPWMTAAEISQAIPPAYTKFIGEAFLAQYATRKALDSSPIAEDET